VIGIDYPGIEDFIVVAELVLGVDAQRLLGAAEVGLAESALAAPQAHHLGVEQYPDVATKAAVLCSRVVRNHALPDGNKRVGLLLMLDSVERNGHRWTSPPGGQSEIAEMIERLAGEPPRLTEDDFIAWVTRHVRRG
jgi:death-on-curing protein